MITNNAKTTIPILMAILLVPAISHIDAEESETDNLKDVVREISKDLQSYVKDESPFKEDEYTKIQNVKQQYSDKLDAAFALVLLDANIDYASGSDFEKDTLKKLLIQEELKWQKIDEHDRKIESDAKARSLDWLLPPAYAMCNQPTVSYFKQLDVDIDGQDGFEGGNQLYNVARTTLSDCSVKYTLSFLDEDHPNTWIDAAYDQIRLIQYERIADVEVFYVQSSGIYFDETWSDDEGFFVWVGPHGTTTKPFSNTVYVSNTWNHNFDTVDENPNMSKFTWLF